MFSRSEDVEADALFKRGWSISATARHLERDHKTVRSYLDSHAARRLAGRARSRIQHCRRNHPCPPSRWNREDRFHSTWPAPSLRDRPRRDITGVPRRAPHSRRHFEFELFPVSIATTGTGMLSSDVGEADFAPGHQTVFHDAERALYITLPIIDG